MNCQDVEAKIPDLVAGRLPEAERSALEEALAACPHCREYRERVAAFYRLDLDAGLDLPLPAMPALPPDRRPFLRRVAAAAVIAVIALLAWRVLGGRRPIEAELEPIRILLPAPPPPFEDALWLDDGDRAALIADYSGRPLATAYLFPYCPRCAAMLDEIDRPELGRLLGDFVRLKVTFTERIPDALLAHQDEVPDTLFVHTPALLIDRDGREDLLFDIESLDEIGHWLDDLATEGGRPVQPPLDLATYESLRGLLLDLPGLLQAAHLGEALTRLERAIVTTEGKRTRFHDDFVAARAALVGRLEGTIRQVEADLGEGGETAARARGRLKKLRTALGGHPLAARLDGLD